VTEGKRLTRTKLGHGTVRQLLPKHLPKLDPHNDSPRGSLCCKARGATAAPPPSPTPAQAVETST
jgi:hypothetical protein